MNIETVREIVALLNEYPVSEITVEQDGRRLHVRKPPSPPLSTVPSAVPPRAIEMAAPLELEEIGVANAPPVVAGAGEEPLVLTAPMVGLFHYADTPVGYATTVAAGQVVGSIESMKLMNDVVAEFGGRVVEVLVEDGAPVEYGQALFRLAPG